MTRVSCTRSSGCALCISMSARTARRISTSERVKSALVVRHRRKAERAPEPPGRFEVEARVSRYLHGRERRRAEQRLRQRCPNVRGSHTRCFPTRSTPRSASRSSQSGGEQWTLLDSRRQARRDLFFPTRVSWCAVAVTSSNSSFPPAIRTMASRSGRSATGCRASQSQLVGFSITGNRQLVVGNRASQNESAGERISAARTSSARVRTARADQSGNVTMARSAGSSPRRCGEPCAASTGIG